MAFNPTAARCRRTRSSGFTLVEILVSVLLISLFFLSYLEWTTARATRVRQLAALEQMEQVRRAALAFAADAQRNSFLGVENAAGALDRRKAIWPHDNVGTGRSYNRGMAQLLRGGYLAADFSAVYPGTRWVFDAVLGPASASGDRLIWLQVRYEALETYGYGRDFQVLAGAFSQWSRYRESVDCLSDLAQPRFSRGRHHDLHGGGILSGAQRCFRSDNWTRIRFLALVAGQDKGGRHFGSVH